MNDIINLIVPAVLFGIFSFVTWLAVLDKFYPKPTRVGEELPNRKFLEKRAEALAVLAGVGLFSVLIFLAI